MSSSLKREILDLERKFIFNQRNKANFENDKKSILQLKPYNHFEYERAKRNRFGKASHDNICARLELKEAPQRTHSNLKPAIKPKITASENQAIDLLSINSCHNSRAQQSYDMRCFEQPKRISTGFRERISVQCQLLQTEKASKKTPLQESKLENLTNYFEKTDRSERKSYLHQNPRASSSEKLQRTSSIERFSKKSREDFLDKDFQELAESQKQKKKDLQESFSKLIVERENIMKDLAALEKKKSTLSTQQPKLDKIIAIIDSGELSGPDMNQIPDIDDLYFDEEEPIIASVNKEL